MTEASAQAADAEELRDRLTDELVSEGVIASKLVEDAFRRVPRHVFAPGVELGQAYAHDTLLPKRDKHGVTISTVSAPRIQAMMLEQADLRSGMRVLEIGSGGYNAALIAEIVGAEGAVTTIDIDADVIDRAQMCLALAGYSGVAALCADGERGYPQRAPFDRIIITVGAWDIPPAWVDQLVDGGIIVVPLRLRGLTRSIAFVRDAANLVSRSAEVCGFVAMQGVGAHHETLFTLREQEIGLRFDEGTDHHPELFEGAFETARVEVWSGVNVERMEPFDTLHLWLATVLDNFCLLSVDRSRDSGVVTPQNRMACPAVAHGGSLAYLALRQVDTSTFEFGAHGLGPDGRDLANIIDEQVRVWDDAHRQGPGPRFASQPVTEPDAPTPANALVVTKRHMRVTVSWLSPVAADQDVITNLS